MADTKADSAETPAVQEEVAEPTILDQKIIRQVEYYFGDYNLPKDKFLQEQIKTDDGWITLETMLKFQRLKDISEDASVICEALLKSSAKLMEVSDDKTKIRRSPNKPLPELSEARRQEIMARTLYLKGFPNEGTTLDTILEFLKPLGKTDNIQMRNWHDKTEDKWKFKGSVFVTFPSRDEAESFLKLESVKHGDKELIRKWQKDYLEEKKIELKEGKRGKEKRKQNLKDAAEGDAKDGDEEGDEKNGHGKEGKDGDEDSKNGAKEAKEEHVLGAVLVLKGLKETTNWTNIKDVLVELGGDVAFVDFTKGDPEAFCRLRKADTAKEVVAKMTDDKVEIDGVEVEARVLEGEEEVKYLDDQQEQRSRRAAKRKSTGNHGQGGRGRGRGRGRSRGRGGHAAKRGRF